MSLCHALQQGHGCRAPCLNGGTSLRAEHFTLQLLIAGGRTCPCITTNHHRSPAEIGKGRQVEDVAGSVGVSIVQVGASALWLFGCSAQTRRHHSAVSCVTRQRYLGRAPPAPHGEERQKMFASTKLVSIIPS